MEEGQTSIPEVPPNLDCSSSESVSKIVRPGISSDTLVLAGVRFSDFPEPGSIEIPYFDVYGQAIGFSRWRLPNIRPNGQKYHQMPNSGAHVYFPPGGIKKSTQLTIVEGEFKALSIF